MTVNHLRATKTGDRGFSLPCTNEEIMARIEHSLADIRATLRNYPADTGHPYVAEKLTERDDLLGQWEVVNRRLSFYHTSRLERQGRLDQYDEGRYDVEAGIDIDWPPIGPRA